MVQLGAENLFEVYPCYGIEQRSHYYLTPIPSKGCVEFGMGGSKTAKYGCVRHGTILREANRTAWMLSDSSGNHVGN